MNSAHTTSPLPPCDPPSRTRRALPWLVPAAALAVVPKCLLCYAAYLTAAAGCGLPLPLHGLLRVGLLALGAATFTWLLFRRLRRPIASVAS